MNEEKTDRSLFILLVIFVLWLVVLSSGLAYYKGVAVGTERAIERIKGIILPVEIEVTIDEDLEDY